MLALIGLKTLWKNAIKGKKTIILITLKTIILITLILLSTNAFNLDESKILSFCKALTKGH